MQLQVTASRLEALIEMAPEMSEAEEVIEVLESATWDRPFYTIEADTDIIEMIENWIILLDA